jgi:hypothetical protein
MFTILAYTDRIPNATIATTPATSKSSKMGKITNTPSTVPKIIIAILAGEKLILLLS